VGTIRLRGELSMGVIIPLASVDPDDELPYNEDMVLPSLTRSFLNWL
jgi:hypothetical protein